MQLQEVNYLRTIAILSIVVWHCFVCLLGVWDIINDAPEMTKWVPNIFGIFIPKADMPLFTFISGYLFAFMMKKDKRYQDFKSFLKKKIKRLVIPFFVLGTLVNLTAPERYLWQIFYGEGSHLWYCFMLFWCFIFAWIILKINNKFITWCSFLISFAITLVFDWNWGFSQHLLLLPLGIHNALYFYAYFYLGIIIYNSKSEILLFARKNKLKAVFLFMVFLLLLNIHVRFISFFVERLYCYIFILYLYCIICELLKNNIIKPSIIIDKLCRYSFGIYVFHEWLSWDFYHIHVVQLLLKEYTFAWALIFLIILFCFSFILTHLFLKTRIGRYLIL
jgi:fucose 4-O-acetylase-like acetyltransferase